MGMIIVLMRSIVNLLCCCTCEIWGGVVGEWVGDSGVGVFVIFMG